MPQEAVCLEQAAATNGLVSDFFFFFLPISDLIQNTCLQFILCFTKQL